MLDVAAMTLVQLIIARVYTEAISSTNHKPLSLLMELYIAVLHPAELIQGAGGVADQSPVWAGEELLTSLGGISNYCTHSVLAIQTSIC